MIDLVEYVSLLFGVKADSLFSRDRHRDVVDARHVCMFVIREFSRASYKTIGEFFNKDHCTAIHSIRKAEELCLVDDRFKAKVEAVRSMCSQELISLPFLRPMNEWAGVQFEEEYLTLVQ